MASRSVSADSFEQAADVLACAAADSLAVRIRGGGTKQGWGQPPRDVAIELCTSRLDRILEHNAGDLTVIAQAGVPLATLQAQLAGTGQMLAIDPPVENGSAQATIGGAIAAADSGPLRHRYGAPRDLVLGMTVALSDGTIARSGGKVIKNVAGYDLGKLFTGSLGTLGLILSVSLRLHPLPARTATALGAVSDRGVLSAAARSLSGAAYELEALDFAWRGGRGGLLARCGGTEAVRRAGRVASTMRELGLEGSEVVLEDDALWARQRAGQRSSRAALVKVSTPPSRLEGLLRAVDGVGGTVVGRAALGVGYVELPPTAISPLRESLDRGTVSVILDAPESVRRELDVWGSGDPGARSLMQQVKQRFDPALVCNPGVFVGAI